MSENQTTEAREELTKSFLDSRRLFASRLSKFLLKPDEVEDILQEAYVKAVSSKPSKKIESPQAYLYTIARNLVFKKKRQQAKMIMVEIEDIDDHLFDNHQPGADDILFHKEQMKSFLSATESLPPQCRKVFLMRKIHGLSQKQIAKKLGISTSTVERHITNAIKRCHIEMSESGYNVRIGLKQVQGNSKLEGSST